MTTATTARLRRSDAAGVDSLYSAMPETTPTPAASSPINLIKRKRFHRIKEIATTMTTATARLRRSDATRVDTSHSAMPQTTPTPAPSSPTNLIRRTRLHRVKKINPALWACILLTLLVANFVVLFVHVWYFLPDHNDDDSHFARELSNPTAIRRNNNGQDDVSDRNNNDKMASAKALEQALSSSKSTVRYDIVPSILDATPGGQSNGVVHQLPSIPDRRRMIPDNGGKYTVPSDAVRNLTYFLESRTRDDEEDRPLFIYNPTVLPLDERGIDDGILSDLRTPSMGKCGESSDAPCYVATYRVSNFGNCHGPGRGVPDTYRNYLGLALLDRDLNVAQDPKSGEHYDVVIDLNRHFHDVLWSPYGNRLKKNPKQHMQDCQLIVAGSAIDGKKADRLTLLCNEYSVPVRLQIQTNAVASEWYKQGGPDGRARIYFRNTYGSGLRLTALKKPNIVYAFAKNLHYIPPSATVDGGTGGGGHVEIWPGGPHQFMPIDFAFPRNHDPSEARNSSKSEPDPSFATIDSKRYRNRNQGPLMDRDSGSACCVSIRWRDDDENKVSKGAERRLLLGFSHRKTRVAPRSGAYNYVSRVYAFEPNPPFDVVARSGFFCLGFAPGGEDVSRSVNEQSRGATNDYKLKINGKQFDCPRIHFVTGIAEKMGDEETVIISYGVNDCYPRMVEVSKAFLVGLLKGDPNSRAAQHVSNPTKDIIHKQEGWAQSIGGWLFGRTNDHSDDQSDKFSKSSNIHKKEGTNRTFNKRIRRNNGKDNSHSSNEKDVSSAKALELALSSSSSTVRYDIVPSILDRSPGSQYGVVHQLPSIPDRRRMIPDNGGEFTVPPNAVRNLTYFLESRTRDDEEDRPLFIYNPNVLPLDERVIDDSILSDLQTSSGKCGDYNSSDAPCYVATYRVSNFGNCHGPGRGVPDTYQVYLGLALLDGDLNILRDPTSGVHYDVVIDLNQQLHDVRWSPYGHRRPHKPSQNMQDCEFVVSRSASGVATATDGKKANLLTLLCNEHFVPVRLQIGRNGNNDPNDATATEGSGGLDGSESILFENAYGSLLRLTALRKPSTVFPFANNMQYIPPAAIRGGGMGGGHVEISPGGPHEFIPVDFGSNHDDFPSKALHSSKSEPDPSFTTIDVRSTLTERDSGSACCVSIRWKEPVEEDVQNASNLDDTSIGSERRLLLGISLRTTTKFPKSQAYSYMSRVYAFEPNPPFDIVARSGFFCMGFAPERHGDGSQNDEVLQSGNEQIRGAANEYKLKINGHQFNCPRNHFVTGIAEKMGDEETVIISYGVNDCYPRMVEVSKDFLVGLLKGRHYSDDEGQVSNPTNDIIQKEEKWAPTVRQSFTRLNSRNNNHSANQNDAFRALDRNEKDAPSGKALEPALSSSKSTVRYDIVSSILDGTPGGQHGVVHQLPSIPDRRRMIPDNGGKYTVPPNAVRNLTYFLESRIRDDEEDRPLFIYNPTVLPLDERVIDDSILSDLQTSSGKCGESSNAPCYVATYRVSNFGNCHGPGRGVPDTFQNYLGLALLDGDLNIVRDPASGEHYDAVIDLNRQLNDVRWSPYGHKLGENPKQHMQDCQLIVAGSASKVATGTDGKKADLLTLLCNEYSVPVRLQIGRNGHNDHNDAIASEWNKEGGPDGSESIHFRNTYGSGLRLTALRKPNIVYAFAKNLHYIPPMAMATVGEGVGGGHVEIWPGGPHEFMPIDFATPRNHAPNEALISSKSEPDPSFTTIDIEKQKKRPQGTLSDRDSGSACCVSIRWRDEDEKVSKGAERRLLLGFSHRKTTKYPKSEAWNYVSRVYAFEPNPPFDIVARSGFFCMGFAPERRGLAPGRRRDGSEGEDMSRHVNEQIGGAANEYKLKIHDREFECPRIHFVTGIAEKMGDEKTVIISYGVNDCYPRMVEVSKDFLVDLLKGQLYSHDAQHVSNPTKDSMHKQEGWAQSMGASFMRLFG